MTGHNLWVMRWLISVTAAIVLLVGSTASASVPQSGLWGLVRRGPITPVCSPERPCTAPAPNIVLVFSHNGVVAARATTNRLGKYRVKLHPGNYAVRVQVNAGRVSPIGRRLSPGNAHVVASRYSRVDFMLDTGIR
jgi:hypothetical protein